MGIGNLGGFNPNNINNLKKVGGNKPNQTNGQNNGDAAKGASNETYTPKEVQASALDMLGNLNRGLIGGKIIDGPGARIGGEKDGPTATIMANHGHFNDQDSFMRWQNQHISEFEVGDTVSVGNTNYMWGAIDMGNGSTMYTWIAQK